MNEANKAIFGIRALWVMPNRQRTNDREAIFKGERSLLSDLHHEIKLPDSFLGIPSQIVNSQPSTERQSTLFSQYIIGKFVDFLTISMFCGTDPGGRLVTLTLVLELQGEVAAKISDYREYIDIAVHAGLWQLSGIERERAESALEELRNNQILDRWNVSVRTTLIKLATDVQRINRNDLFVSQSSATPMKILLGRRWTDLKNKYITPLSVYTRYSSSEVSGITDSHWTPQKELKKKSNVYLMIFFGLVLLIYFVRRDFFSLIQSR